MMNIRRAAAVLLALLMLLLAPAALAKTITVDAADYDVEAGGRYDTMEEVAIYLTFFDELPENYITKKEAQALGWDNRKGNLWKVADGCSIGGDRFGNYEGANGPSATSTLTAATGTASASCFQATA